MYQIAVASSDGQKIDGHFGSTPLFWVLAIQEDGSHQLIEKRVVEEKKEACSHTGEESSEEAHHACHSGADNGCHSGVHNGRHAGSEERFAVVGDCRCVLSAKCGAFMERELQKRGVSSFVIDLTVEEALPKIVHYYKRIDEKSLKA